MPTGHAEFAPELQQGTRTSVSEGIPPTSSNGTLPEGNLSDEFATSKMAAIAKYSSWQQYEFEFSSISFVNGNFIVKTYEVPTTVQRESERRIRESDRGVNVKDNLFAMTVGQQNPLSQRWTLICVFAVEEAQKLQRFVEGGSHIVQLKVREHRDRQVVFDCKT